jgi:hypothetical protein
VGEESLQYWFDPLCGDRVVAIVIDGNTPSEHAEPDQYLLHTRHPVAQPCVQTEGRVHRLDKEVLGYAPRVGPGACQFILDLGFECLETNEEIVR